jgi:hypothetical protein
MAKKKPDYLKYDNFPPRVKVTLSAEFMDEFFETDDELDWHNFCDQVYDLSADLEFQIRELAEKVIAKREGIKKALRRED